ncbi:Myotrophin, partial [Geodia barretti]
MFVEGRRSGRDDLLFYVKYDVNEDKDTVDVLRSDSRTLPTCCHTEIVEKLISAGAVINYHDKDGATPLLMASQNGHLEVVALLLMSGA